MKYLYLILAALLMLCLAPMPYDYYQRVRFIALVLFAVFAYNTWRQEQRFVKVALARAVWNIVDVIVASGLIALWWFGQKKAGSD